MAIAIAILVIQVNSVIFHGLYDAIVRDLVNYRFGHVFISKRGDFITRSDFMLVNWLQRIPWVQAAAPRLDYSAMSINSTINGHRIQDQNAPVPVLGIKPQWDVAASTLSQTVTGQYVS
jgi:lipoprotein-releasing system permease protein